MDLWHRASIVDSRCALAHAVLVMRFWGLALLGSTRASEIKCRADSALESALAVAPEAGLTYAAQGYFHSLFAWEWEEALEAYRRSLALDPDYFATRNGLGLCLLALGRMEEADEQFAWSLDLEPLDTPALVLRYCISARTRRLAEAREYLQSLFELLPGSAFVQWLDGHMSVLENDYERGLATIREALERDDANRLIRGGYGWACAVAGEVEEARRSLDALTDLSRSRYIPPYQFAKIHAGLGEIDAAFHWLDKAIEDLDAGLLHVMTDETLENLRGDPRYAGLLRTMNLPLPGESAE
jgi:tetratricopeptide (TPR) repeat protein